MWLMEKKAIILPVFMLLAISLLFSQSYVDWKLTYIDKSQSYVDKNLSYVDQSLSYVDKKLTYVMKDDVFSRQRFVDSFGDSLYSMEMKREHLEFCYDVAVKKFGIGTAIIAATWIVSFVVPGGTIYQSAVLVIAKSATFGALSGSAIGGVSSAGIALLQDKRGDELLYETINGVADGYLIGAVAGFAEGSVKVASLSNKAKKLKDISEIETIFDGKVYDGNGKLIGKYDSKWYRTEKAVRDAEKKGIEKLSVAEKGNYGEMKQDLFMRDRGYERISKNQVTNLTDKAPTGIDGIYYNPNGNPPYVIAEAKCGYDPGGNFLGKRALSTPADGIEMSENWLLGKVTGNNRLEEAVGKKLADEIETKGYEKIIVHTNSETGECTAYLLDDLENDVNILGKW